MAEKKECNVSGEVVFFGVYGLHLRWTKQSFFSYLDIPRPNHGLMYLLCDTIRIEYANGAKDTFHKGNIVYIPQGINYRVRFFGNTEHLDALLINFSMCGDATHYGKIIKVVDSAEKSHSELFYKIISLYTQKKNFQYAVMAHFYRLLELFDLSNKNEIIDTVSYKSILPALSYIDSHVNEALRIPQLSKLCLLSESVFRRRFKTETGKTPSEYISELKLEKASRLLKEKDIPISVIASELNFYDAAYFNKLFRKKYGVPPSVFKKLCEGAS